jgi:DNA modification methylase
LTSWRILAGDCRASMATLEPGSVQTCVTSPPYFGLRDYGTDGQIGLEPTPDEFVAALVEVFREVRRVLRDDGTVWLNLGDSYNNRAVNRPSSHQGGLGFDSDHLAMSWRDHSANGRARMSIQDGDLKEKDLLGIPWMVAFALRADGWYLRSDIIWAKPNPMPESVTDRPTKAHEYLFLLSKGPRYFYDADAIAEPSEDRSAEARSLTVCNEHSSPQLSGRGGFGGATRNRRSVWTVATQPFPGAHFATFPAKLIEPCILAGSSPQACGQCGAPWQRVTEREGPSTREKLRDRGPAAYADGQPSNPQALDYAGSHGDNVREVRTVGWKPSCGHEDGTGTCTVLDPFSGSGTTGMVALRHGRSYIGCELNGEYVELSRERIIGDAPLLNSFAEAA